MADNTPTTLTCPSCGAPLEVDGKSSLFQRGIHYALVDAQLAFTKMLKASNNKSA